LPHGHPFPPSPSSLLQFSLWIMPNPNFFRILPIATRRSLPGIHRRVSNNFFSPGPLFPLPPPFSFPHQHEVLSLRTPPCFFPALLYSAVLDPSPMSENTEISTNRHLFFASLLYPPPPPFRKSEDYSRAADVAGRSCKSSTVTIFQNEPYLLR